MSLQKKLRTEVIQLEDTLAQVRKEYEMLRIEFEQNLAANEQAGSDLKLFLYIYFCIVSGFSELQMECWFQFCSNEFPRHTLFYCKNGGRGGGRCCILLSVL